MPRIYEENQIPPSYTNEYYKRKMREYRQKNKERLKPCWKLELNDQVYIFKNKKDINLSRIFTKDIDSSMIIVTNNT